jgi:Na+/phosphate symporter
MNKGNAAIGIALFLSFCALILFVWGASTESPKTYDPTEMEARVADLEHRLNVCQAQADSTRSMLTDLRKIYDTDIVALNTKDTQLEEDINQVVDSLNEWIDYMLRSMGGQP